MTTLTLTEKDEKRLQFVLITFCNVDPTDYDNSRIVRALNKQEITTFNDLFLSLTEKCIDAILPKSYSSLKNGTYFLFCLFITISVERLKELSRLYTSRKHSSTHIVSVLTT